MSFWSIFSTVFITVFLAEIALSDEQAVISGGASNISGFTCAQRLNLFPLFGYQFVTMHLSFFQNYAPLFVNTT